ncbi:hypothetical protein [Amaricoccus sp.]|uniref:hypothetical protein n=1 Tax=Amaricoccus sp. TaxID=1872485 RepID=UPI001B623258|nr:hypothetical protein [Amaricoccus sp.]MBP7241438.1 hypothetical protein [Amaricoccus sp.]
MKLVLAGALIALACAGARAEVILDHRDWRVEWVDGPDGFCSASTQGAATRFEVIALAGGPVGLMLSGFDLQVVEGDRFPIFVDVDYDRFFGEAEALSDGLLMLRLRDDQLPPFLEALHDGNAVAVYDYARDGVPVSVHSLRGSAAAILKLVDCVSALPQPAPGPETPPALTAPLAAAPSPVPPAWGTPATGRVAWGPYDGDAGRAWIRVAGDLTMEVADDFDRVAAEVKIGFPGRDAVDVLLASDGGQMAAGIAIGSEARRQGFSTIAGGTCASACALAWLGGVRLGIESDGGRVGFHQIYDRDSGTADPQGNALAGSYLAKLGYDYAVTAFATEAGPDDMRWLESADAARLDLAVYWFVRP